MRYFRVVRLAGLAACSAALLAVSACGAITNTGSSQLNAFQKVLLTNNASVGVALISLPTDVAALDPRVDPIPDDDHIKRNTVLGNGSDPDPRLAPLPPADLLWDGTGTGNCWEANTFASAFPNLLPPCDLF